MNNRPRLIIAGTFLLLLYFAIDQAFFPQLPQTTLTIERRNAPPLDYKVEVARTPRHQERGLMYRLYLPQDRGMIFAFNPPQPASFWMKNTFIPLDMLFVNSNNKIIWIEHEAKPHDLTPRGSKDSVSYVIELRSGAAKENQIQIGDQVGFGDPVLEGR